MSSSSITGSQYLSLSLLVITGMTVSSGCTSLFTPDPQDPHLCNGSGCRTIVTPEESFRWYSLSTGDNDDNKSISLIFSKNITRNFSSFSEDLAIAKKRYAPIPGNGTGCIGGSTSLQFINETNAIVNISFRFRSGENISRDVPFVKEDGIWKMDISPRYI